VPARLDLIETRLDSIEARLERLELLAYLNYCQLREVAEYAYLNVRLEVAAEEVKRMPGMNKLQDADALRAGMTLEQLAALKRGYRTIQHLCKKNAVDIAIAAGNSLADARREWKRRVA
jgi:hypothetical protein